MLILVRWPQSILNTFLIDITLLLLVLVLVLVSCIHSTNEQDERQTVEMYSGFFPLSLIVLMMISLPSPMRKRMKMKMNVMVRMIMTIVCVDVLLFFFLHETVPTEENRDERCSSLSTMSSRSKHTEERKKERNNQWHVCQQGERRVKLELFFCCQKTHTRRIIVDSTRMRNGRKSARIHLFFFLIRNYVEKRRKNFSLIINNDDVKII